jgi:hypothetical protein
LLQTEAAARENEPARHVEQTEAPTVVEYWPATQLVQTDAEAPEYVPAAQLLQTEAAVRENKPARHAEQTEAPTLDENLPARQLLQPGAPFCEYVPAAQLPQTEAAAGEKVPAVQSVHAALPIVLLNEPAPHCVHVPPFGPVNPALHEQLLESVLPIGLMAFTGQLAHEETPVVVFPRSPHPLSTYFRRRGWYAGASLFLTWYRRGKRRQLFESQSRSACA